MATNGTSRGQRFAAPARSWLQSRFSMARKVSTKPDRTKKIATAADPLTSANSGVRTSRDWIVGEIPPVQARCNNQQKMMEKHDHGRNAAECFQLHQLTAIDLQHPAALRRALST